ncbi:MAG: alkaline phosphatase family protein [Actinobacteria bacterium]|nr:alkaline phosphatase family protein [Actinomycetota bacterium]
MEPLNRRELFVGATAAGVLGVAGCSSSSTKATVTSTGPATSTGAAALPAAKDAPFDTVVVLMMENRSFDHLLGWLPGADGKQAGLKFRDTTGAPNPTWAIGKDAQGCAYKDPSHDFASVLKQINGGKMDGFLSTAPVGDHFPISYYGEDDLPVMASLAKGYTTFSNYHASFAGPTWPNRFYQHCATTDMNLTSIFPGDLGHPAPFPPLDKRPSKLKLAIWDRLAAAGVSHKYYFHTEPMTGLFASGRYDKISFPYADFLKDAKAGTLPHVSFVDPDYGLIAEFQGTSNDMHPHGSVTVGEAFVAEVYKAIIASPQWDRTVLVINFDEHGGFYDHVAPPKVADDTDNGPDDKADYKILGVRVPAIAVSPFAPAKVETDGPYEHCSVLKMIEWRWGLEPMTLRDKNAKNLADALDFSRRRPPVKLPAYPNPTPAACPSTAPSTTTAAPAATTVPS